MTTPDPASPDAYCTVADARAQGATGDDEAVQAAVEGASQRVREVTDVWWTPRAASLGCDLEPDGYAYLSRRPVTITSVAVRDLGQLTGTLLPPDSYALERAGELGGVDRLLVLGYLPAGFLLTVEPIRTDRHRERRLEVVGVFGEPAVPYDVRRATALLAASYLRPDELEPAGDVNVEGDADAPPRVGFVQVGGTTGLLEADALLSPYVSRRSRLRVT